MRNKPAEKAMLAEIYLRNLIDKYRDLNLKHYKGAATPEVGIFWMGRSGKPMSRKSVSLRDAVPYGEFLIYDGNHHDDWAAVVCTEPEWEGMEYEEVPRGRVVHLTLPGKSRFIVYLPKELRRYEKKILRAFMLPPDCTEFDYSDEHYRL
jgi:hypothetical protein